MMSAARAPAASQSRTEENPVVVVASLPRADSPSAEKYLKERDGETAWTMQLSEAELAGVDKVQLPEQMAAQIDQREHVALQAAAADTRPAARLDPSARAWDEELPSNYRAPDLDGIDSDAADADGGADGGSPNSAS